MHRASEVLNAHKRVALGIAALAHHSARDPLVQIDHDAGVRLAVVGRVAGGNPAGDEVHRAVHLVVVARRHRFGVELPAEQLVSTRTAVQGVDAVLALQGVLTHLASEDVVAVTPVQGVVALPAVQRVVAAPALQHVVTHVAEEPVVAGVDYRLPVLRQHPLGAGEHVVVHGSAQVLNAHERVAHGVAAHRRRLRGVGLLPQINHHGLGRHRVGRGIPQQHVGVAPQIVGVRATLQNVVAGAAAKNVLIHAAEEHVVVGATIQGVDAHVAVERVHPVHAPQLVVVVAAAQQVVAALAANIVATTVAVEFIVGVCAPDLVPEIRAPDDLDAGQHVALGVAAADRLPVVVTVDKVGAHVDVNAAGRIRVAGDVHAGAAVQRVRARPADQPVVAGAATEVVIAHAAPKDVIVHPAHEHVVHHASGEDRHYLLLKKRLREPPTFAIQRRPGPSPTVRCKYIV